MHKQIYACRKPPPLSSVTSFARSLARFLSLTHKHVHVHIYTIYFYCVILLSSYASQAYTLHIVSLFLSHAKDISFSHFHSLPTSPSAPSLQVTQIHTHTHIHTYIRIRTRTKYTHTKYIHMHTKEAHTHTHSGAHSYKH